MSGNSKKRYNYLILKLIVLLLFTLLSCRNNPERTVSSSGPGKNEMADLNRYFVQKDKERIQNYIERKKLNLIESPTGLWYKIIKEGEGMLLRDNNKVTIDYECSLLDGTVCYSSKKLGPKELILGKSVMEPGMNEGLRLLKPGAEAIFIFPPFLAYGLIGDQKMIPPQAIIVYNVNILHAE